MLYWLITHIHFFIVDVVVLCFGLVIINLLITIHIPDLSLLGRRYIVDSAGLGCLHIIRTNSGTRTLSFHCKFDSGIFICNL